MAVQNNVNREWKTFNLDFFPLICFYSFLVYFSVSYVGCVNGNGYYESILNPKLLLLSIDSESPSSFLSSSSSLSIDLLDSELMSSFGTSGIDSLISYN